MNVSYETFLKVVFTFLLTIGSDTSYLNIEHIEGS